MRPRPLARRVLLCQVGMGTFDRLDRQKRARATSAVAVTTVVVLAVVVVVGAHLGASAAVVGTLGALAIVAGIVAWLAPRLGSDALAWTLLLAVTAVAISAPFVDGGARIAILGTLGAVVASGSMLPPLQVLTFTCVVIAGEVLTGAAGPAEPLLATAAAVGATMVAAALAAIQAWTSRNALQASAVSARASSEEQLRLEESASAFERIAGCTSDLFFLVGVDGKVLYASPSVLRFWNVPGQAIRGHDFTEKMPDADRVRANALIAQAAEAGQARGSLHAVLPGGELRCFDTVLNRSRLGHHTAIAISGRDSTEQVRLTEQLQQFQKLEALGQLAGGVAHDFNNLLTVIRSGAGLVRDAIPAGHAAHADLDEVVGAADRGSALTRQLLALVRREPAGLERSDVARVLAEMTRYLPRLLGDRAHLRVTEDVTVGEAPVSSTQLEQVVLNLVLNARDAMPRGGWIRVSARRRQVSAGEPCGLQAGTFVEVAVQDEGTGFGDDVRNRLFEPFFTTKGAGKGSGLGLATARGIVARAGGAIEVSSTPGKGSTFRVLLPRLGASAARLPAEDAFSGVRRARVLVADHDPQLVALVTRLLAARGHEVVTAASAMEARQQAASYPGAVDVVVAGLELGDAPGIEILGEVRRTSPVARAVLVTGEMRDAGDLVHLKDAGVEVVHRPVSPDDLVAVVERAAAQAPTHRAPAMA